MSRKRLNKHRAFLRPFWGTIVGVQTNEPVVALTFDDGPHPVYTPRLLEILAEYKAHATFFVVGEMAEKQPELIQKIQKQGHVLGNHSWSHPSFVEISTQDRKNQVVRWENAVGRQPTKLFRPPYGHQTNKTRLQLWRHGYKVITWNGAIEDWLPLSADEVTERICQRIKPGGIMLLHGCVNDILTVAS